MKSSAHQLQIVYHNTNYKTIENDRGYQLKTNARNKINLLHNYFLMCVCVCYYTMTSPISCEKKIISLQFPFPHSIRKAGIHIKKNINQTHFLLLSIIVSKHRDFNGDRDVYRK